MATDQRNTIEQLRARVEAYGYVLIVGTAGDLLVVKDGLDLEPDTLGIWAVKTAEVARWCADRELAEEL